MKIKVCGVTREKDIVNLLEANIDLLGFNFISESPRYIDYRWALRMSKKYNLDEKFVCLLKNTDKNIFNTILSEAPNTTFQIYGKLYEEYFEQKLLIPLSVTTLKQNHNKHLFNINKHKYLVDNMEGGLGGTGNKFDWTKLSDTNLNEVMIAGGIGLSDIKNLINMNVWGVDLNSKLETKPGIKDERLIMKLGKISGK
ncbi:MAG: phosphoribosylanthranilate isomerase [Gammaproteobacteria bacterium]|uniref:N-(5'-phosphoribosyl)anthranilate isomerase n=1 Tax=SAR86 cluster bacterium TaxID=2030880 RepID=A0A520N099_9GAMM|nr:hypothetical protein [Gammaproteobacteria bacterium]MBA4729600.1 phosphoribosylanthranilate isomerase [SAR86 cluster bacterium]RZO26898.1 MAG: phosphoribosylanthranilate isomerase [SAR86 cluster bacterium]|tara:strand:+ start:2023 stop:2616 length:594 start_codon:yes stop_codon:yes gene_type:complete